MCSPSHVHCSATSHSLSPGTRVPSVWRTRPLNQVKYYPSLPYFPILFPVVQQSSPFISSSSLKWFHILTQFHLLCTFPNNLTIPRSDICTPPLGGGNTPPIERRHPPTQCNFFCFLMFFNVNLLFSHVYTPQTFVYTPPNFKFLEITPLYRYRLSSNYFTSLYQRFNGYQNGHKTLIKSLNDN